MAASPFALTGDQYVLRVDTVRQAIKDIRQQSFHQYFPAYLHLRQQAARRKALTGLKPRWSALGEYLRVGKAPKNWPYYRPFIPSTMSDENAWLNRNLAGSWAPSSLRDGQPPMRVVEYQASDKSFSLRAKHWELAREHLLNGAQVNVVSVAIFLYRDFAIVSNSPPSGEDLVTVFRQDFGYRSPEDDGEFAHLYHVEVPSDSGDWFQPFSGDAD